MRINFQKTAAWLLLAATVAIIFFRERGARPLPASADPAEFSAARADQEIALIGRKPHPTGSDENFRVRDYLKSKLESLGLTVETQKCLVLSHGQGNVQAITVCNVLGKYAGTNSTGDVLLVAHYDTKATTPGAMDNTAAVATLLETMRALKTGPLLRNNIVCLFTDGEESGECGAKAFLSEHPWATNTALVLNFDARGNRGPVIMFETSQLNGALLRGFAEAAPHIIANSLTPEVYKHMPNGTDFNSFRRAGIPGFNFACIDGIENYHTITDTYENFSRETLQHEGLYALSLARYFGQAELGTHPPENVTYFDFLGFGLIRYPAEWWLWFAVAASLGYVATLILACRTKIIRPLQIVEQLARLALLAFLTFGILMLAVQCLTHFRDFRLLLAYDKPIVGGLALIAAAPGLQLLESARKQNRLAGCILADCTCWLVALWAAAIWLREAAFVFLWPLMLGLVGFNIVFQSRTADLRKKFLLGFLFISPVAMLTLPLMLHVLEALNIKATGMIGVMALLIVPLLFFPFAVIDALPSNLLSSLSVAGGAAVLFFAGINAEYTPDLPRFESHFYLAFPDDKKALRACLDAKPDAWTAQWLGKAAARAPMQELLPWINRSGWTNQTQLLPLSKPEITVVADHTEDNIRAVDLNITSRRNARTLFIFSQTKILELKLNGKLLQAGKKAMAVNPGTLITCIGNPTDGLNLSLKLERDSGLKLQVLDQSDNVSEMLPDNLPPASIAPAWTLPFSDAVLVQTDWKL
jgi:hypothetical protein